MCAFIRYGEHMFTNTYFAIRKVEESCHFSVYQNFPSNIPLKMLILSEKIFRAF